ncbi:hypothetical protein BT69DRAFT_1332286 [Atractiella rhizophila]|nr:hypothetical protein BT69DRAFT_1332286 [Atractiella rhizophila]
MVTFQCFYYRSRLLNPEPSGQRSKLAHSGIGLSPLRGTSGRDEDDVKHLTVTSSVRSLNPIKPACIREEISTSTKRNIPMLPLVAVPLIAGGASILAAPTILGVAGFGAAGVVAGSTAAAVQSAIGNVAAGSLFAFAQSIGAAGLAGSTVVAATGAVGAGVAVAVVAD